MTETKFYILIHAAEAFTDLTLQAYYFLSNCSFMSQECIQAKPVLTVLKRFENPLTLNAIKNEEMNFLITVSEQTIMLIVSIEGPNGNADLYMKRGEMPTRVCCFKNILLY